MKALTNQDNIIFLKTELLFKFLAFLREWTMRLVMIISKLGLTLQDFTTCM